MNNLMFAAVVPGIWEILTILLVLFVMLAGAAGVVVLVVWLVRQQQKATPATPAVHFTGGKAAGIARLFSLVEVRDGNVHVRWGRYSLQLAVAVIGCVLVNGLLLAAGVWSGVDTVLIGTLVGVVAFNVAVIHEFQKAGMARATDSPPSGDPHSPGPPRPDPAARDAAEAPAASTCPRCGAPLPTGAPQGLCPRCVLGVGLATQTEATGEAGPHGTRIVPPPQADVARRFPHLEIIEYLGHGGMGVVYKARQPKLNRLVALKILAPEKGADPKFAGRFLREAQALARLSHPNIVTVHDYGEADGMFFLVMEYVDGMTLRQLLRERLMKPEEALAIVPPICEALQFAHEQGIVHRDIKPENVLLDKQGRVKIADFGIAKLVGGGDALPRVQAGQQVGPTDPSEKGGTLTQDQILGTPHYMAPEQVEKPQTVDHRADIYSLGVVFYEMLTGELPLGKFQPPSRKVQVDVRLDEVVLHALEKEPDRRYQHASEVKSDVETIAATRRTPAAAGVTPVPVHIKRWRDLWLWDTGYLALFLVVPVLAAGILVVVLMPHWGLKALWLFAFELVGIGLAATYAWVGHRIQRLKSALPRSTGEVAEGLVLRRPFQSPGLAVLHEDRLELIFITGSSTTVVLEDIVALSEVRWFNGTRLWWKRGFVLELADGRRVGVAVAEPFARRWRARLSRGKQSELPAKSEITPGRPPVAVAWSPVFKAAALRLALVIVAHLALLETSEQVSVHWKESTGELWSMALAVATVGGLVWACWPGYRLKRSWLFCAGGTVVSALLLLALDNFYSWHLRPNLGLYREPDWVAQHPGFQRQLRERIERNLWRSPDANSTGEEDSYAFGPVIERLLNGSGEKSGLHGLDFETGNLLTVEEKELSSDAMRKEWVADHEVDLLAVNKGGAKWDLVGIQTKLASVPEKRWESASLDQLRRALAEARMEEQEGWRFQAIHRESRRPVTFALQTGSGAIGLLQITGFTEDPRGVKIRYKLIHSTLAAASQPDSSASLHAGNVKRETIQGNSWVQRHKPPAGRFDHSAVWTGSEMLIWGGHGGGYFANGGRYHPAHGSWAELPSIGAPPERFRHTAVWTGKEMIVWGGWNGRRVLNDGGRFDAEQNRWTGIPTEGAPEPRSWHIAVWTGREMIVWGGSGKGNLPLHTGGRYDPANNRWTETSAPNGPEGRYQHAVVWTGKEMLVWGGYTGSRVGGTNSLLADGGAYDPTRNHWTVMPSASAPTARHSLTAVWTGKEMIVWGGFGGGYLNSGGRYDPAKRTWTQMTTNGAPAGQHLHTAVWTGSEMIVWGGKCDGQILNDGARYDPVSDRWTPLPKADGMAARHAHTAVWTENEMLVWGGCDNRGVLNDTWAYLPGKSDLIKDE